jgi:hypothetical protein
MATHLIERGQALCGQALLLEGGRLSYQGPARDLPQPDARSGFAEGAS